MTDLAPLGILGLAVGLLAMIVWPLLQRRMRRRIDLPEPGESKKGGRV